MKSTNLFQMCETVWLENTKAQKLLEEEEEEGGGVWLLVLASRGTGSSNWLLAAS